MSRVRGWQGVLAVLLGVAFAVPASPAASAAETLRMVTGNDYKPFTDRSLPEQGMFSALVRAALAKKGYDLDLVFRTWKRGYRETVDGLFAGTFPYTRDEYRVPEVFYSDPVFTMAWKPVVAAGSNMKAATPEDLVGRDYCYPKGYATSPVIREMTEAGKLSRATPQEMALCYRLLADGRVDFVPGNAIQAPIAAREALGPDAPVRTLAVVLAERPLHVIFPKAKPEQSQRYRAAFNAGLAEIRADGTYDEIVARFVNKGGA